MHRSTLFESRLLFPDKQILENVLGGFFVLRLGGGERYRDGMVQTRVTEGERGASAPRFFVP